MTDEPITFVGTEAANARITELQTHYGGLDRYIEMDRRIKVLSDWLDDANAHRDPEARTWGRLAKLAEESGEVVEAYIGSRVQREEALALRLAKFLGVRSARKLAGRLIPGVAIAFNAIGNERRTRALADRAMRFYGG